MLVLGSRPLFLHLYRGGRTGKRGWGRGVGGKEAWKEQVKGLVSDWGTERGERGPAALASCPTVGSSPFQAPPVGSFGPFCSWYPDL